MLQLKMLVNREDGKNVIIESGQQGLFHYSLCYVTEIFQNTKF